jgi:PPOX class probable F420-dependent enzyme
VTQLRLTNDQAELFHQPNFAVVTTLQEDGTPQASVVWVDEADGLPLFNTTVRRTKYRHLLRDARLSLVVSDRNDPYRYIEVVGRAELDENGSGDHINKLSHKYRGHDFPFREGRVIVRLRPERIFDYLDGPPPNPEQKRVFVLTMVCGPSWDPSRERREQEGWAEHAAFMNRLVDEGFVDLGGPLGDGQEAMVVVEARNELEIRDRLGNDPWNAMGILHIGTIKPWTIWLDRRRASRAG